MSEGHAPQVRTLQDGHKNSLNSNGASAERNVNRTESHWTAEDGSVVTVMISWCTHPDKYTGAAEVLVHEMPDGVFRILESRPALGSLD